ncbi:MAG: formate dehydrogenase subunit alpha [Halanaerobiales bacterium]|nr:formate dehydrogenase subunit alpha [Halanaerobiales bacterium]
MKLYFNGHAYDVKAENTILQAAAEVEVKIPTLCYSPHLSISGACRLCLVEDETTGKLLAACSTPISPGMRLQTESQRVVAARREILDLLLSDHPLDCLTCEANGDCQLQDLAYQYDITESSFGNKKERRFELSDENPFIQFDPDKCIICGKCIRADQEVQSSAAIDFVERGFQIRVGTPFEQGLGSDLSSCVFCGLCVEYCPSGALIYKPALGKGRSYQFTRVQTTCPYCGVGCQLELQVKDNQVIQVGSVFQPGSPNPRGETCVKGRFAYDYINHPDRLTTPLIKKGGEFIAADWEEALNLVANRLLEIKNRDGSTAIAGLSSAKCTNEENYLMQKFIRAVIGNNNIDHCARLCHASTVAGLARAFGSGAMTNSIAEVEQSDVILIIGSNPTENHPVIASKIKRAVKKGTKLIVADPRRIELAQMADLKIQQRPGTDVALINGMIHLIIKEGLYDQEFISERTENFAAVQAMVNDYSPETAAKITGVPAERIRAAARLYAKAQRGAIYFAMGITQHHTGTDNVLSLANLAMLTGNIGREGTGVNPLRGQNNVQGACDMGALPNVYPGYQPVDRDENRQKFAQAWNTSLSTEVGLTVVEMFNAVDQQIKAMYIMGENPMLSDPDQHHISTALQKLDFLVVQDIFLTATAQFADVVFPAVSFAEKNGSFTNTERRIQLVNQAIQPPGQARADWEIIAALARKMGYPMYYTSPAEIMNEIASLTPIYGGIQFERLLGAGIQWPCRDKNCTGTKYLHQGRFTRGRGKFHPVTYLPPAEEADQEYPFIMMTGRMLYHFHTGTMTRRSRVIDHYEAQAYVEINKKDARKLGIDHQDRVRVISRRGEVETYARVGERVKTGQLFMPFHYAESPANRLTNSVLDPVAKIPELKVTAVKIERIC